MNGIPDLSKTKFNDLTHSATCMKANLTKSAAGHNSLRDSLTRPYQGLYILTLVSLEESLKMLMVMLRNQVELILKVSMASKLGF